jgi:cytochrome c-type biogenesis protein CcmH/NrfG
MNKGQISFAFAGLLFGSLVGFVVAHQMYAGRGAGFAHPPTPSGMAGGGSRAGGQGSGGAMPGGQEGAMASMEAVTKEIASLKELLSQEPENSMALTRLGNLYFDAGMFNEATEYYGRALEVIPDDVNVRTDLGTAFRNTGQAREALTQFEAAVEREPGHWKGWFNIGIVSLYDLGDYDRARDAFDRVAELKPGTVDMSALQQEIERVRAEKEAGGAAQ